MKENNAGFKYGVHYTSLKINTFGLAAEIPTEVLVFDPTVLAPANGNPEIDNLLLAIKSRDALNLTLDYPLIAVEDDQIVLYVDGQEVSKAALTDDYDKPVTVTVPADKMSAFKDGVHKLEYSVKFAFSGNESVGPASQFVIDRQAPSYGAPLSAPDFDEDIIRDGVTPDNLVEIEGKQVLQGTVAGYEGMAIGDILTAYIDSEAIPPITITAKNVGDNDPIVVNYPREILESKGDGQKKITYNIVDRAGNSSTRSLVRTINTLLKGAVEDLLPPVVPLYEDDLVINDTDARQPVEVVIPGNDRILLGYEIVVDCGGIRLPAVSVTESDVGNNPLLGVRVPYYIWSVLWVTGDTPVPVSYEVRSGASKAGSSPSTTVVVNLELAGGPDPDPEDEQNTSLKVPTVFSASGKENEIPAADSKTDGSVLIPWVNTSSPAQAVFKINDVLEIYYGKTLVTSHTISQSEINAGVDLSFVLPSTAIQNEGSGIIKARYNVSRKVSGNTSNTSRSPLQDVTVVSEGDIPGAGDPLPKGIFKELNSLGNISYNEALDGATFAIPYYKNKASGDELVMTATIYGQRAPTVPVTSTTFTVKVGSSDEAGETIISGQSFLTQKFLLDEWGNTLRVGRLEVTYTAENTKGKANSEPASAIIDVRHA